MERRRALGVRVVDAGRPPLASPAVRLCAAGAAAGANRVVRVSAQGRPLRRSGRRPQGVPHHRRARQGRDQAHRRGLREEGRRDLHLRAQAAHRAARAATRRPRRGGGVRARLLSHTRPPQAVSCVHPAVVVHDCRHRVDGITKYLANAQFGFDHAFSTASQLRCALRSSRRSLVDEEVLRRPRWRWSAPAHSDAASLNRLEVARDIASQAQRGEQQGQRAPIETLHGSE